MLRCYTLLLVLIIACMNNSLTVELLNRKIDGLSAQHTLAARDTN